MMSVIYVIIIHPYDINKQIFVLIPNPILKIETNMTSFEFKQLKYI